MGSNTKSEQKYGGIIKKCRKGCYFGVGTLVSNHNNTPHNEFFIFSTIIPPSSSWANFQ